jgi:protein gp37
MTIPIQKIEQSKIQWTGPTWNPWHGCQKVSAGCKFCYMFRDKERYGQKPTLVMQSKTKFNDPLKWKEPQLIFTCSWSDWFIEEADAWRPEAWEIIKNTPQHTYQILTKRPERIKDCLPPDWGDGYPNVWLGVSVESNEEKQRLKILSEIPARIRFISAEPLIGELDLEDIEDVIATTYHWLIIGGESGNNTGKYRFRECELQWVENLINQGKSLGLDVFVKQLGTHLGQIMKMKDRYGGNINEWPLELRVRQFPEDVSRYSLTEDNTLESRKNEGEQIA